MEIGGLRWGLREAEADRLLAEARAAALTYDDVGVTVDPERAPHLRGQHRDVGRGRADFDAAVTAVRTWGCQRGIGAEIRPAGQDVARDVTALVVLHTGPFRIVAPVRVVEVVERERAWGFAYGTLPGHPEQGEEGFLVEHLPDDVVRFTIRLAARPALWSAKALGPLARVIQDRALRGYLQAVADEVARVRRG